jgi:hypothetical protein
MWDGKKMLDAGCAMSSELRFLEFFDGCNAFINALKAS